MLEMPHICSSKVKTFAFSWWEEQSSEPDEAHCSWLVINLSTFNTKCQGVLGIPSRNRQILSLQSRASVQLDSAIAQGPLSHREAAQPSELQDEVCVRMIEHPAFDA